MTQHYQEYIDLCHQCAVACERCSHECLHEKNVSELVHCIELNHVCAQVCRSAAAIMAQGSELAPRFCAFCAEVCQVCAQECAKHEHMPHCRECSQICYHCAQACEDMGEMKVKSLSY